MPRPTPSIPTYSDFLVLRPSLGLKVAGETRLFNRGDVLGGVLVTHPVNAARKVLIRTDLGVFTFNEEDIQEVGL
jgi:hypothetical protein